MTTKEERDRLRAKYAGDSAILLVLAELDAFEATAQVTPDDVIAVADENAYLRKGFSEAANNLAAGSSVLMSMCEWCGEKWPRLEGCKPHEAEAHARQHVYRCSKHPMKAERDALRSQLDEALNCFLCIECGLTVKADEDGCCATCGRDCIILKDGRPLNSAFVDHVDSVQRAADRNGLNSEDVAAIRWLREHGGIRTGRSVECTDPQCGDSTWDHECNAGYEEIPEAGKALRVLDKIIGAH